MKKNPSNTKTNNAAWKNTIGRNYNQNPKKIFISWLEESIENKRKQQIELSKNESVILDIGSGSIPLYKKLNIKNYKCISIDLVQTIVRDHTHLIFDLNTPDNSDAYKQMLSRLNKLLVISKRKAVVDYLIFSEILNYVDYKKTLKRFLPYLKKDGTVLILNQPQRGEKEAFISTGVKRNKELIFFLEHEMSIKTTSTFLKVKNDNSARLLRKTDDYLVLFGQKSTKFD